MPSVHTIKSFARKKEEEKNVDQNADKRPNYLLQKSEFPLQKVLFPNDTFTEDRYFLYIVVKGVVLKQ